MKSWRQHILPALLLAALGAAMLWAWAAVDRSLAAGFVLEVTATDGSTRRLATVDVDPARARRLAGGAPATARWTGWLPIDAPGAYDVAVAARAPSRLLIDDAVVLEHDGRPRRVTVSVPLARGARRLTIEQELGAGEPELRVSIGRSGEAMRRLDTIDTFRDPPGDGARRLYRLGRIAGVAGALLVAALFAVAAAHVRGLAPDPRGRLLRLAAHAAAAVVTLYGAALRVDALAGKYEDTAPRWAARAAPVIRDLHPRGMRWVPPEDPYGGDPFSYLRCAREMTWFYGASVREPLFVFATKLALRAAGDRDIAVNLASMAFSTLLVPATYLLGLAAFSAPVGLVAALGIAVERQVVALGVEGWRDDAFALFVVLSAAALLKLRAQPTRRTALGAGIVFGAALLTRITSLSLLVPGLIAVAAWGPAPRPRRWRAAGIAALVGGLLVAPFLLTCALRYGDPLYSINAHTRFYRSRAAGDVQPASHWLGFLAESGGPLTLADTGLVGLTSYPFTNKWEHFDYWAEWLGPLLAVFSLVGLLCWLSGPDGRLLLVVLLSSLLPYAFTWEIPGGSEWRFTLHAYPFYLLAAASALPQLWWIVRQRRARPIPRRGIAAAAVAMAAAGVAVCGLGYGRVREQIHAGRDASIVAGPRDIFFFADGWSRLRREGHVFVRYGDAAGAAIGLPLAAGRPYRLVLRVDPVGDGPTRVVAAMNGTPLGALTLTRGERRIGSHSLDVPAALVASGRNELRLRSLDSASGPAFRLWLVRVERADR